MKKRPQIINVIPYRPLLCRAKGGCENTTKHLVTIQRDPEKPSYTTLHLCDGHLAQLRADAAEEAG